MEVAQNGMDTFLMYDVSEQLSCLGGKYLSLSSLHLQLMIPPVHQVCLCMKDQGIHTASPSYLNPSIQKLIDTLTL